MWICFRFRLIFKLPAKKERNIKCLGFFIFGEKIFSLSKPSNAIVLRSRILLSVMDTDTERRGKFLCFFQHNLEPNRLFWSIFFLLTASIYENYWQSKIFWACVHQRPLKYRSSSKLHKAEVYWCSGAKGWSSSEGSCMDLYDSALCISRWLLEVPFSLNTSAFS